MIFPIKRRVLTEKYGYGRTTKLDLFKAVLYNPEPVESFLIDKISLPNSHISRQHGSLSQEWDTASFRVLECYDGNGKHLSKWLDSYFEYNVVSSVGTKAVSFLLEKMYDNGFESEGSSFLLLGCAPVAISEEEGYVSIEIQPSYCEVRTF